MFEYIRTHQRLMQFFLALIILPSFAFVGIGSYSSFGDDGNAVAKVSGKSITQLELDAAQREQLDRYRQMLGAQFDPKMLDTPEAKQRVLDDLITKHALSAEILRNHLTVSDPTIRQIILGIQGLTKPDGSFNNERYKALLGTQGMTPAMHDARLRSDLALQQVDSAISTSAFSPKWVANRVSDITEQEREIQELPFKTADYASQVKISDSALQNYYKKNGAQFEIPEHAKIEYVILSSDQVASKIEVSESDIQSQYDQNITQGRYSVEEQRRASHILISVKKDASSTDKGVAKAKVENLLGQLRKTPGDFAKLAKEYSQDTGSAARGGDLDYFGKNMMVKPFEEAAYKLKQGEISNVVESDFGYHIIELTGIKPSSIKALAEVKNEIATELKKQKAQKKYVELAKEFSDIVYDQADSLKPVAEKLQLKIETASNILRLPNPSTSLVLPINNPKFLKALFSNEAIKNKHNTEAVDIGQNTLIAAHIIEYQPAAKRSFDEVQPIIRAKIVQIEAAKLAKQAGETKRAALISKEDMTGFSATKMISRSKDMGLEKSALAMLMKADVTKLPAYVGVEVAGQGYSLYRINKVIQPVESDANRRQGVQQQIANVLGQQEMFDYVAILKKKAKVKVMKNFAIADEKNSGDLEEK